MKTSSESRQSPVWQDPTAVALLLAATLVIMSNATISPALPGLEALFASEPNAGLLTRLLVPAPSLAVLLAAPFAGFAADRFGRRLLLIGGLTLFVLTGPAGLFLSDLTSILASRLALGVSVAMIMTAQTALVGDCFTGERRTQLMGLQVSARNFGGMAFIALAGLLAGIEPRLPFAIYGLAILYLPFIWRGVRDIPNHAAIPESAVEIAAGAGEGRWLWPMPGLAGLQVVTAMIFFLNPTQVPFYAVTLGYDGARTTGLYLAVLMCSGGLAALLHGRIKRRIGDPGGYAAGFGLLAIGFGTLPAGGDFGLLLAAGGLIGAGYAIVTPIFIAIALQLAPAWRRGLAGGIMTSSMFLGQFASPFASMPAIAVFGYEAVFYATAIGFAAMALVAGLAMVLRPLPDRTRPA
ncbi:MAG: MFS transporter [Hoeflea sp.]|uniref:MFS transporter n=1 Tax=Hoeflea sp. TaxID=1940281 RepID=UPI0032ECB20E